MPTKTAGVGHNNPPDLSAILADRYADLKKRVDAWKRRAQAANLEPKSQEDVLKLDKLVAEGAELAAEAKRAQTKEKEEPAKMVKAIDGFFLSAGIIGLIDKAKDPVNKASAKWKIEQAEAERRAKEQEAERLKKKAEEEAAKADAADARGDHRQADIYERRADAAFDAATAASAVASQDVGSLAKVEAGGIRAAANVKMICTAVDVGQIDLEALRMFIKPAALVDAVNAALRINPNLQIRGAVLERDYSQRVTRRG